MEMRECDEPAAAAIDGGTASSAISYEMSGTRYAQFCALARAAEIIGGAAGRCSLSARLLLAPMRFRRTLAARLS